MNNDIFDLLAGAGPKADYSLEEIEAAEKRMKKKGGSLQENLQAMSGRKSAGSASGYGSLSAAGAGSITDTLKHSDELHNANAQLLANSAALDKQLKELNESLKEDFGVGLSAAEYRKKTLNDAAGEDAKPVTGEDALKAFTGLDEELKKKIFGQDAYIKKLLIAMKRPFVAPPDGKKARNAILITGPKASGRHSSLKELSRLMAEGGITATPDIYIVDLSRYTDASQDKLFYQDMYAAFSSPAVLICFEGLEAAHPSFLQHISRLVCEGSISLPGRYVSQKGQLISVQDSLASEAVGELCAKGKYLIFVSEKSLDKMAGIMGAPFVDALKGDVCETKAPDAEAISAIAERELSALKEKAKKQCGFAISADDDFLKYSISRAEKQAGVGGVLSFYASVMQALTQLRLERELDKGAELKLYVKDGRLYAGCREEEIDLSALLPKSFTGELSAVREELDAIVGLTEIKKYVLGLEEYYAVQKRREEEGLKTGSVSKHMIFTGSPGTGKTTIARIISRYLKAIGVLSGGQLVEVSRADLVGRYVGHTAPLTQNVLSSAIGGVLFIDEAYSLYRGKDDSFGLEAIDTLVKGIEDHRDDLIVILAGYSHEMQEFLTSNSGLKSRFPNVIDFPDYTGEELLAISRSIAGSKGYTIDEGADEPLTEYFNRVQAVRAADAGNGRLARNMVEAAIVNQSRRLVAEPEADLSVLLPGDFELEEIKEDKDEA